MSLATSAAAKALFGDLLTPQQKVAANTPATLVAEKFADYLEENQQLGKTGGAGSHPAPKPEDLIKGLFGNAYDPGTKSVRLDKITAEIQKRSAKFAQAFRETLASQGIDPNSPIALSVGADGRVIVDNSNPDAEAISKIFAENPDLAQAYRDIAVQNDHLAMLQVGAAYVKEWQAAKTEVDRSAIWNRYSGLMDRLAGLFQGRMTFGAGTAIPASQQIVLRMGLG
ncbi:MAG TPA: hypothetical protein VF194_17685 [Ferrovibrio sp.]|uniref:hypothetical protein n=1 Tax=Ferrovibrio sp. TaxID=1917215 RepID=UPI002ED0F194